MKVQLGGHPCVLRFKQLLFAHGEQEPRLLTIDPRTEKRLRLDTLIHEMLHEVFRDASETKVTRTAREMATILWKLNYRVMEK